MRKSKKSKNERELILLSTSEYEEELVYKLKTQKEKNRFLLDENDIFAEIILNPEKYLLPAKFYN